MRHFVLFTIGITFFLCSPKMLAQVKKQNSKAASNNLTYDNIKSLENTGYKRCETIEYERYLREKFPERASSSAFENWISSKILEVKEQRAANPNRLAVVTIPVVVHVIHNGEPIGTAPNITDAQVISQIDVMNEDFRKMSGTLGDGTGVDSEIQFCLARQTPDGCVTNGINRVDMSSVSTTWSGPGGNTDTMLKPMTQWDPTQYMNMWSVVFSDPTSLGYAQFPDASGLSGLDGTVGGPFPANTDGVVAGYSFFGDSSRDDGSFILSAPFDRGRTMTHEVGHFLGLRHIWGDSNCGDDFCADTPNQQTSSSGCPTTTTCDGNPDLTTNYMDYSDDACMNNFTQNQKDRFLAVLANSPRRMELISSDKCTALPAVNDDGAIEINGLNFNECNGEITPDIKLTNWGDVMLTSATITYDVDGGTANNFNWTGSLANGETVNLSLPVMQTLSGPHTFNAIVINPNGNPDQRNCNDNDSATFTTISYDNATEVNLELTTDDWCEETSWEFRDSSNTVLYSGGPYTTDVQDNTTFNETFTVVAGECYTFTINDSQGDGICCDFGSGSYELTTDDATVIFSGGQFASSEATTISTNTLAVEDVPFKDSITMFPNPVEDNLTIKISNNNAPDGYRIYNILGQKLVDKESSGISEFNINTTGLNAGMYFIKVTKANESVVLPFIKK